MAKGKWTRQTWIEAALWQIAADGVSSVAVDKLATQLGATRGSFYWHFRDRAALLEAAMSAWEDLETHRVNRELESIADPRERMRALFHLAMIGSDDPIPGLESAILAQLDHPAVAPTAHRVTEERLRILTRGFGEIGLRPAAARRQAVLAYATYVGWLQCRRTQLDLMPEVAHTGRRARLAENHVLDQLIPAGDRPD